MAMPGKAPEAEPEVVTITFIATDDSASLQVSPGRFHISKDDKSKKQQVEWKCDQSGFTVDFGNDSPFEFTQFQRSSRGSVLSGHVKPGLEPPGDQHIYKYTVRVGGSVLDPEGQVDK
jgi:hypothetical protein